MEVVIFLKTFIKREKLFRAFKEFVKTSRFLISLSKILGGNE